MTERDKKLSIVLNAADSKKAFDMKILDISTLTNITDYFAIFSGNSERQVTAIADEIIDKMKEEGHEVYHIEGYRNGRWILIDFGDIVVHVFHKEDREFYNLERLWIDGKDIDIKNIINI